MLDSINHFSSQSLALEILADCISNQYWNLNWYREEVRYSKSGKSSKREGP